MTNPFPPGPNNGLLGMHHLSRLRADVLGFSAELARTFGDIVYYRVGPIGNYLLTNPQHIQQVLVQQAKCFHRPARTKQIWSKFDGQGLSISDGDFWLRQRRLVQPAFGLQRVPHYAGMISHFAQAMVERWQPGMEINAADEMAQVTLAIAAKALFDADLTGQAAGIRDAMAVIQEKTIREMKQIFPLPDWLPLPHKVRERRVIRFLRELVMGLIQERRASGMDKGDLLSMLLLAVDEEGDRRGMTDEQARDEAITLLLAGFETNANALVWTLYLLAEHPSIQAEAAEKVRSVLGGRPPGLADLPRLPELEMVFKESLRLYPPAYFWSREAITDTEVGGYPIRRGSLIHLVPYLVHRDPRWFDQPGEFRPERFAPGQEERMTPFSYFPFGGGPHICIGKGFAMMETQLVLAAILGRYRLTLAPGQGRPEFLAQITLSPKGGVRLMLHRQSA